MIRFDGRVAIVTGAGKGLGRAYAEYLAARGARLVLNNRRREVDALGLTAVDHLAAAIRAGGGEAVVNQDSVEDPSCGPRMVQQALDTWGRLDILINNAGIDRARSFAKQDLQEFMDIFRVNFHGSLHTAHAAFPVMREAGFGRIVMTTSSAGLHGGHGLSAYASAKAALIGLTRSLATEGRSRNVLVNAIAPYAATPMTAGAITGPLAEALTPGRVAPMVGFLCSDANASVNGQVFVAGGGRIARAVSVEAPGIVFDDAELTLETLAGCIGDLQPLDQAREFDDAPSAYRAFIRHCTETA